MIFPSKNLHGSFCDTCFLKKEAKSMIQWICDDDRSSIHTKLLRLRVEATLRMEASRVSTGAFERIPKCVRIPLAHGTWERRHTAARPAVPIPSVSQGLFKRLFSIFQRVMFYRCLFCRMFFTRLPLGCPSCSFDD